VFSHSSNELAIIGNFAESWHHVLRHHLCLLLFPCLHASTHCSMPLFPLLHASVHAFQPLSLSASMPLCFYAIPNPRIQLNLRKETRHNTPRLVFQVIQAIMMVITAVCLYYRHTARFVNLFVSYLMNTHILIRNRITFSHNKPLTLTCTYVCVCICIYKYGYV